MRSHLPVHCLSTSRQGFTLIEVAVTIGILSFLAALLLPAIAGSRAAARRIDCVSRLKNIGIALTNFEQTRGRYPESAPEIPLLPYLDQQPLYDRIMGPESDPLRDVVPHWYLCPSDPAQPRVATNYARNIGFPYYGYNGFFKNPWATDRDRRRLSAADIHDGLSNTVSFCEIIRHDGVNERLRTIWCYPEQFEFSPDQLDEYADFVESLPSDPEVYGYFPQARTGTWFYAGLQMYHHMLPPNRPSAKRMPSVGREVCLTAVSMHPGGANALYGDGRVDFVSQSIDRQVWRELGSRSSLFLDGEGR